MRMKITIILTVILPVVFELASGNFGSFRCSRDDVTCGGQGNCGVDGTCTCTNQYVGFACWTTGNSCGKTCNNQGTCYVQFGSQHCLCPIGFTGDDCSDVIPSLICGHDGMTLKTRTSGAFSASGSVFPAPSLPKICVQEVTRGQTYTINFIGGAGCGFTVTNPTTSTIKYEVKLIMEYDAQKLGPTDEIFTLSCTYSTTGAVVSQSVSSVAYKESALLPSSASDIHTSPLTHQLTVNDVVATTANVGDKIDFKITLPGNTAFSNIKATLCTVDNGAGGGVRNLVSSGCVVDPELVLGLSRATIGGTGDLAITLSASAFKQTGAGATNQLRYTCDIILCHLATASNCVATSPCGTTDLGIPDNGIGRRKRDAQNTTDVRRVTQSVTVLGSHGNQAAVASPAECSITREMIITLTVLFLIALILIVIIAWFARREAKERHNSKQMTKIAPDT